MKDELFNQLLASVEKWAKLFAVKASLPMKPLCGR
jgi:hypothetical protein